MRTAIRVLCVDDDPGIVELVTTYLDDGFDFETVGETDPRAAVERVREGGIECVVSDYRMPGMDGLELLSAVRDIDPDLPFILFTGQGSESIASEAVTAGVTDYIRKATGTDQYDLLANRVWNAVEARRARTNYREVFDAASDAMVVLDPETETVVDSNRATQRLWGYDAAEIVGVPVADLTVDKATFSATADAAGEGPETIVLRCVRADGERFWGEATLQGGTLEGQDHRLAVIRDVTERRRRERAIDRLVSGQQELLAAESVTALGETAATVAVDVLSFDAATVYVRDGEDLSTLASARMPTPADRKARARRVLGADEPRLETTDVWRELHVPVGDRGVVVGVVARTTSFPAYERSLAMALGNGLDTALERIDRERQLRDRGERLERRSVELRTTDRINAVIRNVHWSLIRASSRAEIERLVAERVAASDPYSTVWVGRHHVDDGRLEPAVTAGLAGETADGETLDLADVPSALARAVADRTTTVVQDRSLESGSVRAVPPGRDHRSVAYVPVVDGASLYGVVAIAATEADVFGDSEREVLGELGELIGAAIGAVQRKRALFADDVVELEFEVSGENSYVGRLSDAVEGRVEVESILDRGDDAMRMFLSIPGADPDEVASIGADDDRVGSVEVIDERRGQYEFLVERPPLVDDLTDQGVTMGQMFAESGVVRFLLELPRSGDVRRCHSLIESTYDDVSLVARRELSGETASTRFGAGIPDRLTDRQREVLRVATEAGYFEWPRERTGEEVAERLGIGQSTFTEHLRSGERKVFEALFGDTD